MCAANENKKSMSAQKYSQEDRQELVSMARKLRRMKRQLLLNEVQAPLTSVDGFRSLITRALQAESGDGSDSSVSTGSTIVKPGDSLRTPPSRSIKGSVSFVHMAPSAA